MTGDARSRFAAVTGAGVFLLVLLGSLVVAGPAAAMLYALVAGVASGIAVLVVTAAAGSGAPVPAGRRVDRVAAEPVTVPAESIPPPPPLPDGLAPPPFVPGGPGGGGAPGPDDTARIFGGDLPAGADLHQTIRLDAESLQYALPDVSAEDILREREGIDEAFLKAGAGIDEPGTASENVGGGAPG